MIGLADYGLCHIMTTTIKISDELAAKIDEFVGHHGFTSRTDFVRKAILYSIVSLHSKVTKKKVEKE